ncbi:unnamed protein product [Periconia digitata]|uniref:Uncharacterized protein n=1 Tax=Periconia digitata TaxID=1303443 RepID=A0A9W4UMC9_9PLEO|nr:unnamed protein product [Periconia digitata]
MKLFGDLSVLAIALALSSGVEARRPKGGAGSTGGVGWSCDYQGATNDDLKNAVSDFDKLFGTRTLRTAGNQCYWSICRGFAFGFCNSSSRTRDEKSGEREKAMNTDLNGGNSCRLSFQPIADDYVAYKFVRESDVRICEKNCGLFKNDVRRC